MIMLTLPFHRKARIWFGDLPQACLEAKQVIDRSFCLASPGLKNRHDLAIEIFVPKGARFEYGLLGGEFIPDDSGCLQVFVSAASEGVPFNESLASKLDEVWIGLPLSYARAIMDGVAIAEKELAFLPSGKLHFNCAAYGTAGSCVAIFRTLSTTIVKLLRLGNSLDTQREMVPFLQAFMEGIRF